MIQVLQAPYTYYPNALRYMLWLVKHYKEKEQCQLLKHFHKKAFVSI